MFGATLLVALSYMIHAKLEPRFDTIRARLLVTFLALCQPLVRGWTRYYVWLKFKRTPKTVIETHEEDFRPARGSSITNLEFWDEETGKGREALLPATIEALEKENWSYSMDTGWKDWDVQVYGSFWWGIEMLTVTEYHGGPKALTRVRLTTHMVATTFLVNAILLGIIAYRQFGRPEWDWGLQIPYLLFAAVLYFQARQLKARVAELVGAAAQRCKLTRVKK
jgi:hypothetical protein